MAFRAPLLPNPYCGPDGRPVSLLGPCPAGFRPQFQLPMPIPWNRSPQYQHFHTPSGGGHLQKPGLSRYSYDHYQSMPNLAMFGTKMIGHDISRPKNQQPKSQRKRNKTGFDLRPNTPEFFQRVNAAQSFQKVELTRSHQRMEVTQSCQQLNAFVNNQQHYLSDTLQGPIMAQIQQLQNLVAICRHPTPIKIPVKLYHYTTPQCAEGVIREKSLKHNSARLPKFGPGIYFTELPPTSRTDAIIFNNYGTHVSSSNISKSTVCFEFEFSELPNPVPHVELTDHSSSTELRKMRFIWKICLATLPLPESGIMHFRVISENERLGPPNRVIEYPWKFNS